MPPHPQWGLPALPPALPPPRLPPRSAHASSPPSFSVVCRLAYAGAAASTDSTWQKGFARALPEHLQRRGGTACPTHQGSGPEPGTEARTGERLKTGKHKRIPRKIRILLLIIKSGGQEEEVVGESRRREEGAPLRRARARGRSGPSPGLPASPVPRGGRRGGSRGTWRWRGMASAGAPAA